MFPVLYACLCMTSTKHLSPVGIQLALYDTGLTQDYLKLTKTNFQIS
jgi:hypothetical protein